MKNFILLLFIVLNIPVLLAGSTREMQFENEKVKVWKTTIPPTDKIKMHRHEHDRVIVGLKGGHID